jgi:C4-type Zn-finger protein
MVNAVVEKLNKQKKTFESLSKKAKTQEQCIICMDDFSEKSEVSELKCDERHIFHTACLQKWMQQNLNCPLCKTTVKLVDQ